MNLGESDEEIDRSIDPLPPHEVMHQRAQHQVHVLSSAPSSRVKGDVLQSHRECSLYEICRGEVRVAQTQAQGRGGERIEKMDGDMTGDMTGHVPLSTLSR